MAPGVTVVVPTHRRPELMRRAVVSVLEQEYSGEIEVIVVFDACQPFVPEAPTGAGRGLRVVTNTRTRGLAGARNTGIMAASHDYVAFLDDDDAWLPGKLRAQMSLMASEPDAILVGTAMEVDAGGRHHVRLVPHNPVTHEHLLHNRLAGLHSSSFLFRRAPLVDSLGMVDEDVPGSYGEDYDLLLRASRLAPIPVVNQPLTSVTWQGQSYFFGKWGQYAEALTWLLQAHPEFLEQDKAVGRIESQIAFARAAAGDWAGGRSWAVKALRHDPVQPKAFLALLIGTHLLPARGVIWAVQRVGKGI